MSRFDYAAIEPLERRLQGWPGFGLGLTAGAIIAAARLSLRADRLRERTE